MSTYVYGFTHAAHPLDVDGIEGVGLSTSPLRVVRHDGLAAVVSDAPPDLRAKRRDLEAHEWILEKLCEAGTVLPMRFGTVAPDDEAVRTELDAKAERYRSLLAELDGKAEVNVKGVHREDDVLRDLLLNDQALRDWNENLRSAGGGTPEARMEFGEEVAAALEERRARDAAQVLEALRPHAERISVLPSADGCFVNASFLVADAGGAAFDTALAQAREAVAAVADVNLYGPLPPYSFVTDATDE
jgi:Gas vesicle synthesis protein GvpL/GvpF